MTKRDNSDYIRIDGVVTDEMKETDVWAACNGCFWRTDLPKNLAAARKQAHRHIRLNPSHVVEVHQERTFTYRSQAR